MILSVLFFPLNFKIDFIYFIYLYFSQGLFISTCSWIYCVVHDDFRILILLPLLPKYCDCRHWSLCLVYEVLGIEPRAQCMFLPTELQLVQQWGLFLTKKYLNLM